MNINVQRIVEGFFDNAHDESCDYDDDTSQVVSDVRHDAILDTIIVPFMQQAGFYMEYGFYTVAELAKSDYPGKCEEAMFRNADFCKEYLLTCYNVVFTGNDINISYTGKDKTIDLFHFKVSQVTTVDEIQINVCQCKSSSWYDNYVVYALDRVFDWFCQMAEKGVSVKRFKMDAPMNRPGFEINAIALGTMCGFFCNHRNNIFGEYIKDTVEYVTSVYDEYIDAIPDEIVGVDKILFGDSFSYDSIDAFHRMFLKLRNSGAQPCVLKNGKVKPTSKYADIIDDDIYIEFTAENNKILRKYLEKLCKSDNPESIIRSGEWRRYLTTGER